MKNILFQPSTIGTMALKNRLVRSATFESMATEDGYVTDSLVELYRGLSKGGVGLIIAGYSYIQQNGRCAARQTGIYSDECVLGLKTLVETVHEYGTKIASQITHAGRQTLRALLNGAQPVAPSSFHADPLYHTVPRAMTVREIHETIDAFAEAAGRSKDAGFDAVQLHAAHGYLLAQFLSPYTNRRTDEWGGHLENRLRFVLSVLEKVRAAVGPDYPILMKISAEEAVEGGISLSEACHVANILTDHGIDAVEVSGGILVDTPFPICKGSVPIDLFTVGFDPETKSQAEAALCAVADATAMKEAYWASHARRIKSAVGKLPVILVGGMRYPHRMEALVNAGVADYLALSRPLVREPNLPLEMAEGRKSPVTCSFCNRCTVMVGAGKPLRCYNR